MSPTNIRQFEDNMKEIREKGPLDPEEMNFMKRFGDVIHHTRKRMFGRG
jgi:hypothetical protein